MEGTTKTKAIAAAKAAGHTALYYTGESGDHGYGSRLYYAAPGAPRNSFGHPLKHAEVSRVGREWFMVEFGK